MQEVLPPDALETRAGQDGADLAVQLGCTALPFEERTACHATRYAIGKSKSLAFRARAYALERDRHLAWRVPSRSNLEEDELGRFAAMLRDKGEEALSTGELEFLEAYDLRTGVRGKEEEQADVFKACKGMAMCDSSDEANGCGQALASDTCLADAGCSLAKGACRQRCRHCAWVLRGWPAWQGVCTAVSETTSPSGTNGRAKAPAADAAEEGFLSPPFEEALQERPPPTASVEQQCLAVSWAVLDLVDATRVVAPTAGGGAQQRMGPWPWSPMLACSCLGQCPYSSVDSLRLRDAGCLGPSSARETEAWMRRTEEEAGSEGREYRAGLRSLKERGFADAWFPKEDVDELREVAKSAALESKGVEGADEVTV